MQSLNIDECSVDLESVPVMDTELHASLSKLVGTWRTTGQIVGGLAAGESWAGHDIYEWFPGEKHLVHRVDVTIGGQRNEGIEIFTPRNDDSLTFDQISFNSDGSIERATGSFDEQGRYLNELPTVRAALTFEAADQLHAIWERQDDNGEWSNWMDVNLARIGHPHIEIKSRDTHNA